MSFPSPPFHSCLSQLTWSFLPNCSSLPPLLLHPLPCCVYWKVMPSFILDVSKDVLIKFSFKLVYFLFLNYVHKSYQCLMKSLCLVCFFFLNVWVTVSDMFIYRQSTVIFITFICASFLWRTLTGLLKSVMTLCVTTSLGQCNLYPVTLGQFSHIRFGSQKLYCILSYHEHSLPAILLVALRT
jgi:hypothetical protein